ncbi:MAG: cache domain-containing protein, partial [Chloroflexota bacterium]
MNPFLWPRAILKYFAASISRKIIIPYVILTVVLAAFGTFVVTQLIISDIEDRLNNRLIAAGQVVSETIVDRENLRLETERVVANTRGVAEFLVAKEFDTLNEAIFPLIANDDDIDSIIVIDSNAQEVIRLQRSDTSPDALIETDLNRSLDFRQWDAVQRVLDDPEGRIKDVQLFHNDNNREILIYTIGPIVADSGETVGAVLVGTYLTKEISALHELALADLTFFWTDSSVVESTLIPDIQEAQAVFGQVFTSERYNDVL